ncbi:MAG: purine-nucleoside phosphorylase [Clostridia bacterium]|nr:purine-nucleoside phosphorylase [Clostridia bacterium]
MKLDKIIKIINKKYGIEKIDVAIVAGSGQIGAIPDLENVVTIPYSELGLPKSRVQGHEGKLMVGTYCGKVVAAVSRYHYYETGDITLVRKPFEILRKLKTQTVVLLTSSGGLNESYEVGDIMLIEDHINFSGINPLIGIENLTFTAMANCYDEDYNNKIKAIAKQNDIKLQCGTFMQFSGPTYETMAEVKFARKIGGDTVSMSTAHDCIICRHFGMKVCGMSLVVNSYNNAKQAPSHEEVLENAQKAVAKIKIILSDFIR